MESWRAALHAFALLIAVNAAPVIVAKLLHERWNAPLDFGVRLPDGQRLFGPNKTWRGLICGILAGIAVAAALHESWLLGLGFAVVSLAADTLSSCIKRRMGLAPGAEFIVLDQLGEALLPLAIFVPHLVLDFFDVVLAGAAFVAAEFALAPVRHRAWRH